MHRKRRGRRKGPSLPLLPGLLCTILLISGILFLYHRISGPAFPDAGIRSRNVILTDLSSHQVLVSKNPDKHIYPASMTKLMTALAAIECISDPDLQTQMTEDAYQSMAAANASMSGFLPGETVSLRDLLYGMILPSGGDCCICMAEYISGSESAFVERMNQKARDLGMKNTHFTNSTGLHDMNHYSTVRDISILMEAALQEPLLYEILTSRSYDVPHTNGHPDGFTMYSTMFQYLDGRDLQSGHILGGKTGYTSKAGQCLASVALLHDDLCVLVTAGAFSLDKEVHVNTDDALRIYDQFDALTSLSQRP